MNPSHHRVAVMNNGTRKGGFPVVIKTLYTSPGFKDLWQMHFSQLSGRECAAPPVHSGRAYWVKVSARDEGTFTVTNTRNSFSKVLFP